MDWFLFQATDIWLLLFYFAAGGVMVDHCIPLPGYIGCKPTVLGAGHTLCVQANHVIYTGAHIAREAQFIERGSLTHIDSRIFQDINHLLKQFLSC